MKILIVSDTHAKHGNLDYVLEQAGSIDLFIHLGDVEGDEEYLDGGIMTFFPGFQGKKNLI